MVCSGPGRTSHPQSLHTESARGGRAEPVRRGGTPGQKKFNLNLKVVR